MPVMTERGVKGSIAGDCRLHHQNLREEPLQNLLKAALIK